MADGQPEGKGSTVDTIEHREWKDQAGLAWSVGILSDDDIPTRLAEECYTDAQRAAYERGEWRFVGVCVTLLIGPITRTASLWGIEYGDLPGVPHTITVERIMTDPYMTVREPDGSERTVTLIDDLQEECREAARIARDALTAANL